MELLVAKAFSKIYEVLLTGVQTHPGIPRYSNKNWSLININISN